MSEYKNYNNMENILQDINGKFISLNEEEEKRNNGILREILNRIESKLKATDDSLFKAMYRTVFYGGSYYDGLKVNKPNEYDLDLVMGLPRIAKPTILPYANKPGFVEMFLDLPAFNSEPTSLEKYKGLHKLLDGPYLNSKKCVYWMQGILYKVLADYYVDSHRCYILTTCWYGDFKMKMSKREGSPAFTLIIESTDDNDDHPNVKMSIDLVPCFVFTSENWPDGFRNNPTNKSDFFVVPKYPLGSHSCCWRLSFQEQERVLIDSKQNLKPALRLLKKLRDVQNQGPVSSYFLKTAVLLEIEYLPNSFWSRSLSLVFMTLLKNYSNRLLNNNIPYYWNDEFNLIGNFKDDHFSNLYNRTQKIINDLERNLNNPDMLRNKLYEYLLTLDEQRGMWSSRAESSSAVVPSYSGMWSSGADSSSAVVPSYGGIPDRYVHSDEEDYYVGTSTSTDTSSTVSSLGWGLAALAIMGGVTAGAMAIDRYMNNDRRRNN